MAKATLPAAKILAMFDAGVSSSTEIARRLGLNRHSVHRLLTRNNRRLSTEAALAGKRRGLRKFNRPFGCRAVSTLYDDCDPDLGADA